MTFLEHVLLGLQLHILHLHKHVMYIQYLLIDSVHLQKLVYMAYIHCLLIARSWLASCLYETEIEEFRKLNYDSDTICIAMSRFTWCLYQTDIGDFITCTFIWDKVTIVHVTYYAWCNVTTPAGMQETE